MPNEKEWRVIPDFPKYEITFDGEVRTIEHKAIMAEGYIDDETEPSVSLWREGGIFRKDIRGLIYTVFPEFKHVSLEARMILIKRFATEMQHWLGGEAFLYEEFEQLADIVIDEGWKPPDE